VGTFVGTARAGAAILVRHNWSRDSRLGFRDSRKGSNGHPHAHTAPAKRNWKLENRAPSETESQPGRHDQLVAHVAGQRIAQIAVGEAGGQRKAGRDLRAEGSRRVGTEFPSRSQAGKEVEEMIHAQPAEELQTQPFAQ